MEENSYHFLQMLAGGGHFKVNEITIVDYGLGNIAAFVNMYKRLSDSVNVAATKNELELSKRLILPGVGSFDWAVDKLNSSGLRACLENLVLGRKLPILGVCVGMQVMADSSEEGKETGLSWIKGCVRHIRDISNFEIPVPHMGWNKVEIKRGSELFGNRENPKFYFLHSYAFEVADDKDVLAVVNYESMLTCAINNENIYGTQFHPEKSHRWGAEVLFNFAKI